MSDLKVRIKVTEVGKNFGEFRSDWFQTTPGSNIDKQRMMAMREGMAQGLSAEEKIGRAHV